MPKIDTFKRLKEQEREKRRTIILDAAEYLFASKPFTEVSMRRIAKEAGISPASIYTYFPDQEALFLESFLRGCKGLVKTLHETIEAHCETGDLMTAFTEAYVRYFTAHDTYFRMMAHFMLYAKLKPRSAVKLNRMIRSILDEMDRVFKALGMEKEVRFFSHTLFSSLNGILITFRRYPGRTEEKMLEHMLKLSRKLIGFMDRETEGRLQGKTTAR